MHPLLKPHQVRTVEYNLKNRYAINALQMGLGKAQPISCTVYTPYGPKKMGDVVVGDFVIGKDGKPKRVLGVYPQGVKKTYFIKFSDGSSTYSCEEHLWNIQTNHDKWEGNKFRTWPLRRFKDDLRSNNWKWLIPICDKVEFEETFPPIPPYSLGVLIGDGGLSAGGVTVTNASETIYNRLEKELGLMGVTPRRESMGNTFILRFPRKNRRLPNPIAKSLENLGLNKKSEFKRIPDIYKYGTTSCRISLLTGLLDTDGYVAKDGTIQYTSASKHLVLDVVEVVQSLGGISTYPKHKKTNFNTDAWTTTLKIPFDIIPLSKPEKLARYRPLIKYTGARHFIEVSEAAEQECVCISVEDSLYLTDNFIVTHNTFVALETGIQMKARTLIICPAYLKLKWKAEIQKFYPTAIVSVLDNAKSFYRLWDTDFCIISYSFVSEAEMLFEWADLVAIDEAHYLKSTDAKRTNAVHKLIYENSLKSCLLLTGTPIKNRVHEFYSLISICKYAPWLEGKDTFLDTYPTWLDFADKFSYLSQHEVEVTTKKGQTFMMKVDKWSGVKNISDLKKILTNHYIEIKSKDVLNLPKSEIIDIPVEYKDDEKLLALFEAGMAGSAKSEAALAMAPHTIKFAKDLSEYGPVVIFSDHVAACEKIAKGLGVPAISGSTPPKRRDQLAQQFMNGEATFIVATIGSFSTGNDLQISSKMIFNDPSWVPGDILQAMFRIIRIGQTEQCHFYRMIGSYQSQYIYDTVFEKAKTIEKTLEGIQ